MMSVKITETAARQVLESATQGGMAGIPLRIAAKRNADGSIAYAMGFDEAKANDSRVEMHGVEVVVAPTSTELVQGMTIDYVEMEPGQSSFIFMNPNDPHYIPPADKADPQV